MAPACIRWSAGRHPGTASPTASSARILTGPRLGAHRQFQGKGALGPSSCLLRDIPLAARAPATDSGLGQTPSRYDSAMFDAMVATKPAR